MTFKLSINPFYWLMVFALLSGVTQSVSISVGNQDLNANEDMVKVVRRSSSESFDDALQKYRSSGVGRLTGIPMEPLGRNISYAVRTDLNTTETITVYDQATTNEMVLALYPDFYNASLAKRAITLTYGATVAGFSFAGYVIVSKGSGLTPIAEACWRNPEVPWIECIDTGLLQLTRAVVSITTTIDELAKASGLLQGFNNIINLINQRAGGSRKREEDLLCQDNYIYDSIPPTAFDNPNYGIKASCMLPCYVWSTWSPSTVTALIQYGVDVMVYNMALEMQGTFFYPTTKAVMMRCHIEGELDQVDACPQGITGGLGCTYQGLPPNGS